jgi:hypothetical protein
MKGFGVETFLNLSFKLLTTNDPCLKALGALVYGTNVETGLTLRQQKSLQDMFFTPGPGPRSASVLSAFSHPKSLLMKREQINYILKKSKQRTKTWPLLDKGAP